MANFDDGCESFYKCENGIGSILKCGNGFLFNPKTGVCDYIYNVQCQPPPTTKYLLPVFKSKKKLTNIIK